MPKFAEQTIPPTKAGAKRSREELEAVMENPKSTTLEKEKAQRALDLLVAFDRIAQSVDTPLEFEHSEEDEDDSDAPPRKKRVAGGSGSPPPSPPPGSGPNAVNIPLLRGGAAFEKLRGTSWTFSTDPESDFFYTPERRPDFFCEKPACKLDLQWTVKLDYHPHHDSFFVFMKKEGGPGMGGKKPKNKPSFISLSVYDLQYSVLGKMIELKRDLLNVKGGKELVWLEGHDHAKDNQNSDTMFYAEEITISNPGGTFFCRPIRDSTAYGTVLKVILHNKKSSSEYPNWAGPSGRMPVRTYYRLCSYLETALENYLPYMENRVSESLAEVPLDNGYDQHGQVMFAESD